MGPTLRLANDTDAAGVLAIYTPIVAQTAISFELEPPSLEETRRRIARGAEWPYLVCAEGEEILGFAYAVSFRERPAYRFTVETTVYVAAAAQRRGIAGALYRSLLRCLVVQGYRRVIAGITLPNVASVALHESLGFCKCAHLERVGWKLGSWHDVGYWSLSLQPERDSDPPPAEPRRTCELAADPSFAAAVRSSLAGLAR
jgi:L-amino acid N-acyltransferase YncA